MGKKFMQKFSQAMEDALDVGFQGGWQKACDLFLVAMATEFGWGPDRISKLADAVDQLDKEYGKAWRDEAESDWAQKELDAVLKRVCSDRFVPFYERNWAVKKIQYDK